jgi:hypothetical protein
MKTFLHNKKPLTLPGLTPSNLAARQAFPAIGAVETKNEGHDGTQIEIVKEGDKVARLIITCACGERIEVECLYPAGS